MIGTLLDGRYKVIQILSQGGFGQTYIAEDTRRPGQPKCVLKLLQPANRSPEHLQTARRLFNSEAETLEKLGHHNQIPQLLAYFEDNQKFYLVQQLIVGHPLTKDLQSPWVESQIIEFLKDVLGILDFVHRAGVIHRDLKPDNLIRRAHDSKLVLIDFGAVKEIGTQMASPTQMNPTVAIGTQGYMPAEQSRGRPRPGSDLYAVGMIAIQALTGQPPQMLPEDPVTGEVMWQGAVSSELIAILQNMVRYDYRQRYQSAAIILQALQQLTLGVRDVPPPTRLDMPLSQQSSGGPPTTVPSGSTTPQAALPTDTHPQFSTTPQPVSEVTPLPGSPSTAYSTQVMSLPSDIVLKRLDRGLDIGRFAPFIGVVGIWLFNSHTWIVLLGVTLAIAGAALFCLRSVYPSLGRAHDPVFAAVLVICGGIFLFQDDRLDPLIQLSEMLLSTAVIFSAADSIRYRIQQLQHRVNPINPQQL